MALEHCYLLPTLMKSVLLFSSFFHICSATDTITQGKKLNFSETLVSASGDFELGFFSPGQSNNIYLGIWYKRISSPNKTVVWVANREYPLKKRFNSSSFLTINEQGNLLISDGKGMSYTPTSTPPSSKINVSATLLDSGNFILRDGDDVDKVVWQSFDYPSDTLLPGMTLGFNSKTGQTRSLTSWSSMEDPSPGVFSTSIDSSLQLRITKGGSQIYWREEVSRFLPDRFRYYYNLSYISDETGTYFTYSLYNYVFFIPRLSMDLSGQIKMFTWLSDTEGWKLLWSEPSTPCEVFALCGAFSSCDMKKHPYCQCLEGFHPYNLRDWNREDRSAGCMRKTNLECEGKDEFIEMKNVKFPMDAKRLAGVNAEQCKLACLINCNCNAYAYTNDRDCLTWRDEFFGLQENYYNISSFGEPLFLKIAASELNNSGGNTSTYSVKRDGKQLSLILTLPITLTILIFSCLACCLWRRKLKQRGKNKTNQDLLSHDFNAMIEATKSTLCNIDKIVNGKKWDMELPLFSFQSVSACTNNFNDANKLGEGGFGPVYKGKLLNGQEVAIKRLSRGSGQGMEELKNEATLIAKLQHRNLVRLLGCCIEGEEKILIYEYMPNKSLDFFLFVPKNRSVLDWEKRTHIIDGIAQGLLYLHLHSRLRIVHRDLKASNILLDRQMNAKISDFGMARMFGGNESQGSTNRIVGTYGYMSPEYVKEGLFSIKSDVFSFGVLLLEILSGKRNTSFHRSDSLNLIGHAWNLWRSEKGLKLIDPMLRDSSLTSKVLRYINARDSTLNSIALRYINVGLLCVQEQAADRPTMSDVVMMLSSQAMVLPSPNHPGFYAGRSNVENNPSSTKQPTIVSTNNVTVSALDGR